MQSRPEAFGCAMAPQSNIIIDDDEQLATINMNNKHSKRSLLLSLTTATLVPSALLCLSIFFGVSNTYDQYVNAQKELKGIQVVTHLYHVMSDLQRIRAAVQIQLYQNDRDLDQEIQAFQSDIIADFNEQDWPELRGFFGIDDDVMRLQNEVEKLFGVPHEIKNRDILFHQYTTSINDFQNYILLIGDRSHLVLDSELETYYLIEASVKQTPRIIESISRLRGLGSRLLTKATVSHKESHQFREYVALVLEEIDSLKKTENLLGNDYLEISSTLNDDLKYLKSNIAHIMDSCSQYPCVLKKGYSLDDFFTRITSMQHGFDAIFFTATSLIKDRLEERENIYFNQLILITVLTFSAILTIFLISYYFYCQQINIYQELERLSITDPLTSISNRRLLEPTFIRELQRARRDHNGLAFGILDIDQFKQYNDVFGHQAGDEVLKQIAGTFKTTLRRGSDYYFRYGGEEFCFFVNAKNDVEVKTVVNKIQAEIKELALDHPKNIPFRTVTASIGVAFLPNINDESLDFIMQEADKMLYLAKSKGRNRSEYITIES